MKARYCKLENRREAGQYSTNWNNEKRYRYYGNKSAVRDLEKRQGLKRSIAGNKEGSSEKFN